MAPRPDQRLVYEFVPDPAVETPREDYPHGLAGLGAFACHALGVGPAHDGVLGERRPDVVDGRGWPTAPSDDRVQRPRSGAPSADMQLFPRPGAAAPACGSLRCLRGAAARAGCGRRSAVDPAPVRRAVSATRRLPTAERRIECSTDRRRPRGMPVLSRRWHAIACRAAKSLIPWFATKCAIAPSLAAGVAARSARSDRWRSGPRSRERVLSIGVGRPRVGQQPFELRGLVLERLQPLHVGHLDTAELGIPRTELRWRHHMFPAQVDDRRPGPRAPSARR